MKLSGLFAALSFLCLAQLVFTSTVDPEQALFAYTRCMEIYAEPLSGRTRLMVLKQWKEWTMKNGKDHNTECYAQCTLERLGLFDPNTRKFEVNKIDEQFSKYGEMVGLSANDRDNLKDAFSKINGNLQTCENVYNEYMNNVHNDDTLLGIARKLYHGTNETTKIVYDKLVELDEPIRAKNQSYFEFCEKQYYRDNTAALCRIRQYEIDETDLSRFEEHTACIFKGLRYIDSDKNFNSSEIIRDFALVNKPNFEAEINQCTNKNDVLEAYRCFVKGDDAEFVKAFKEAFDYREIRSRDYAYRLKKPNYDQNDISQQVENIDQQNSC